jgi:hypothetical protein
LFVGVSLLNFKYAKTLLDELDPDTKKNIKLFQITDKPEIINPKEKRTDRILFS